MKTVLKLNVFAMLTVVAMAASAEQQVPQPQAPQTGAHYSAPQQPGQQVRQQDPSQVFNVYQNTLNACLADRLGSSSLSSPSVSHPRRR